MSADRAFKQTQNSTKPRERAATRVAAVLLGVFFVIGCPTAVLMHASLRIELEATIYKRLSLPVLVWSVSQWVLYSFL
jgi:hypothetical protein